MQLKAYSLPPLMQELQTAGGAELGRVVGDPELGAFSIEGKARVQFSNLQSAAYRPPPS
uniref:Uncharacterized protein n=1 Tax=Arundo donax TaxID=35708 RepID=A0A0A9BAF4_ARUDO